MNLALLFFSTIVAAVSAAPLLETRDDPKISNPVGTETSPDALPDFASEVFDFWKSLSDTEKAALVRIYINHATGSYTTDEELVADIKEKTPDFYEKTVKLILESTAGFNRLGEEAKTFLSGVAEEIRQIQAANRLDKRMTQEEFITKLNTYVKRYEELSNSAKEDLDNQFPAIFSFLKNPKIQSLVKKALTNKFESTASFLDDLKEALPQFHGRIMMLWEEMVESFNSLNDEAKAFLSATDKEIRQAAARSGQRITAEEYMTMISTGVERWKALSEEARTDIEKHFPTILALLKHRKAIVLLKRALAGRI